jgi:large subunit ribosomal protein L30
MATKKSANDKSANDKVTVRRIGSPVRRDNSQRATLMGLGLKRANQIVELDDTPAVQGMIRKVQHLVEIVK